MSTYLQEARTEIPMMQADFSIPGIDGVEQEVARFEAEVEKEYAAEFPDQPIEPVVPRTQKSL